MINNPQSIISMFWNQYQFAKKLYRLNLIFWNIVEWAWFQFLKDILSGLYIHIGRLLANDRCAWNLIFKSAISEIWYAEKMLWELTRVSFCAKVWRFLVGRFLAAACSASGALEAGGHLSHLEDALSKNAIALRWCWVELKQSFGPNKPSKVLNC